MSKMDDDIIKYLNKNPRSRPTSIAKGIKTTLVTVSNRLRLLELQGKVERVDRGIWIATNHKGRASGGKRSGSKD